MAWKRVCFSNTNIKRSRKFYVICTLNLTFTLWYWNSIWLTRRKSLCLQHHFVLMKLLQRMTSSFRKLSPFTALAERKFLMPKIIISKSSRKISSIFRQLGECTQDLSKLLTNSNISMVVFFLLIQRQLIYHEMRFMEIPIAVWYCWESRNSSRSWSAQRQWRIWSWPASSAPRPPSPSPSTSPRSSSPSLSWPSSSSRRAGALSSDCCKVEVPPIGHNGGSGA